MTNGKPHPIALGNVMFVRSVVVAIQNFVPSVSPLLDAHTNTIDVNAVAGSPGHYSATMRTVINQNLDPSYPYFIDMECVARLTADNTLGDQEAHNGVMITAHSVLYGAIREAVAWITSRQPHGTVMLGLSVLKPTVLAVESEAFKGDDANS
jgi:hypothetical protein